MHERAALIHADLQRRPPRRRRHRGRAPRPPEPGRPVVPLKTRILLADDHTIVRQGLRFILDAEPDLEVVAEVANGNEAVDARPEGRHRPRDPRHRDADDDRPAGRARAHRPPARAQMLILSMHDDEGYLFEALKAGTVGLRAQVGRRPRPRRGVPRGDARRAVPLRRGRARARPRLRRARRARARRRPRTRSRRASSRSSSSSPRATRTSRSPRC